MTRDHQSTLVQMAPALFVLLWSTGYVGARFVLPFAEPFTFISLRFAIVFVLLAGFISIRGDALPRDLVTWWHLVVSGILLQACFIGGIFFAISRGVDVGVAALIAGMQPLLTAVIAAALLHESLNRWQWFGFVVGFCGLSLVVLSSIDIGTSPALGLTACFVGLLGITCGTLYQKRYITDINLVTGSTIQYAAAFVPCAILALTLEDGTIQWNLTVTLALVWLCLVLSIGAIGILLYLIREGGAARVSSLFYLVPPVTALQAYLFFDERLGIEQLVGIVLAAVGVGLVNLAPNPKAG